MARLHRLVLLLRAVILRDRLEAPAEWVAEVFRAHGWCLLGAFAVHNRPVDSATRGPWDATSPSHAATPATPGLPTAGVRRRAAADFADH